MEARKRGLLTILDASARHGKQCPTLAQLGALLGSSADVAYEMLNELRDDKKISWKIQYRGSHTGNVRVVTIAETGLTTATPAFMARGKGAHPLAVDRSEIEKAKTILRRTGRIVFDAEVTDGSSGKGLIKVDGRNREPGDVLRMAQASVI